MDPFENPGPSFKVPVAWLLGMSIPDACIPGIEASLAMYQQHLSILDAYTKHVASEKDDETHASPSNGV
jgi:hypothetical protein